MPDQPANPLRAAEWRQIVLQPLKTLSGSPEAAKQLLGRYPPDQLSVQLPADGAVEDTALWTGRISSMA